MKKLRVFIAAMALLLSIPVLSFTARAEDTRERRRRQRGHGAAGRLRRAGLRAAGAHPGPGKEGAGRRAPTRCRGDADGEDHLLGIARVRLGRGAGRCAGAFPRLRIYA